MGKEILAIPEERVPEVVKVIRIGLSHANNISNETFEQLAEWCDEYE